MRAVPLVLAILMCVGLCSCSGKKTEEQIAVPILETKEIKYKTCTAEISDISEQYYQKGSYSYPYSEVVKFKAGGQIASIEVDSPCDVKKGDLICTLYNDDVAEEIEKEEIRLEQSKSTVEKLKKSGVKGDELQMAQYELELEQLKFDHLSRSLEDYNVYAPCDGEFTMYERWGQPLTVNTFVGKGDTVGFTSDKSKQYLCVEVYDNPLNNVNFGTSVTLEQGYVTSTGTVTDVIFHENGDYSTYVYVINPDDKDELFDFGEIQVVFDVYSRLDTVVIPQKAVKNLGGRTYVNLLVDGVKIEQDIELGIEDNQNVEVLSGLVGGEEIILN